MPPEQGNSTAGGGFNPFSFRKPNAPAPDISGEGKQPPAGGAGPGGGNTGMEIVNPGAGAGAEGKGKLGVDGKPVKDSPTSGLDNFSEMFKVDPKKQPAADPLKEKLFNMDPTKMAAGIAKLDFAKSIAPDVIAKIGVQDPAAFSSALNTMGRDIFMQAMQAFTGMVEGGIQRNNDRFSTSLEGRFRDFQVQSSSSKHPALSHAATKPVVQAIKQMLSSAHPDLSPDEVQEKAEEYFLSMGSAINSFNPDGTPKEAGKGGTPGNPSGAEPDWLGFLETGELNKP